MREQVSNQKTLSSVELRLGEPRSVESATKEIKQTYKQIKASLSILKGEQNPSGNSRIVLIEPS